MEFIYISKEKHADLNIQIRSKIVLITYKIVVSEIMKRRI